MFPPDFIWGTAASSTGAEGAAPASDWYAFEEAGLAPRSSDGNGFTARFAGDFKLLADAGINDHRLTLEWARIEPDEGRRDTAVVELYAEMLAAAAYAGVRVWPCLHDYSLPGWFLDAGGVLEDRSRRWWARHVAFCAETFGGQAAGWFPINEPTAYAARAYATGDHPPARRNPWEYGRALRGVMYAWRDAWRELKGGTAPVVTAHSLSPIFPSDNSVAAKAAAADLDGVVWRLWVQGLQDGVIAVPGRAEEVVPDIAGAADIVGFTYYHGVAVRADGSQRAYPSGARLGPLGYAPWSEGLGITIRRLAEELPGYALLVAGHGVGTDDDAWRRDLLRGSMAVVEEAVDDGIDVRGFFHRTAIDGYEWRAGYGVPFGLFDRDREPKESASSFPPLV